MTNQLMIPQGTMVPAALQHLAPTPGRQGDLSAGVGGVPVISIRGKSFRFKYRGAEALVTDPNNPQFPQPWLDVVIVKASPRFSKIYYASAYQEGSDEPPDCFSVDGIAPDPSVAQPQCATCGACPHNVWGSKITPQGTKTKACQDNRRIAVVPAGDPMNASWGGVALLRTPPASLAELASFGQQVEASGLPYQSVVVRMSFDQNVAYPRLVFQYLGIVNDAQANAVLHWLNHEQTDRILSVMEVPAKPPAQLASVPPAAQLAAPVMTPAAPPVAYAPPPSMPQPAMTAPVVMAPPPPPPAPVVAAPPPPLPPPPPPPVPQPIVITTLPPGYPPTPVGYELVQNPDGSMAYRPAQPIAPAVVAVPPAPPAAPAAPAPGPAVVPPTAPVALAPGQPAVPAPTTGRRGNRRQSQPAPATQPAVIAPTSPPPVMTAAPPPPPMPDAAAAGLQQPATAPVAPPPPPPQPQPTAAPAAAPNGVDAAPIGMEAMLGKILGSPPQG